MMKFNKLFVLSLVALFMASSICFAAGPTGPGAPGDIFGQNKYQHEPHRIFRLVHASPNAVHVATHLTGTRGVITADSPVVWDDLLDDGVSVELTTTSGDGRIAGIMFTDIVSTDVLGVGRTATEDAGSSAGWGWLQTYGLYQDARNNASTTIAVGDSVCAGPTVGTISSFAGNTTTTHYGILGGALDAVAVKLTGDIFITCD